MLSRKWHFESDTSSVTVEVHHQCVTILYFMYFMTETSKTYDNDFLLQAKFFQDFLQCLAHSTIKVANLVKPLWGKSAFEWAYFVNVLNMVFCQDLIRFSFREKNETTIQQLTNLTIYILLYLYNTTQSFYPCQHFTHIDKEY